MFLMFNVKKWGDKTIDATCKTFVYIIFKMDLANKLKQFDAYPKTLEDFRVKTFAGALGMLFELCIVFHNCFYFKVMISWFLSHCIILIKSP